MVDIRLCELVFPYTNLSLLNQLIKSGVNARYFKFVQVHILMNFKCKMIVLLLKLFDRYSPNVYKSH